MRNEQGNVLYLILIAVVLFAALSYAVTQSNRGGGDAGDETNNIAMSQYTQLVADLRVTIQRMILGGVNINNIKLCSGTPWCNASFCSTGVNCVFAPEGGGFDASRIANKYGMLLNEASVVIQTT